MNRAELGALRDAIDTILNWPDSVRGQIAQWLQPNAAKPIAAHHGTPSSRSSRHRGLGPGVEEAACERALGAFADLGAIIEPVPDDFASTEPIWLVLTQSFWNARFRRYVAEFGSRMSETLLRQMDTGAGHSAVALQQAMFERTRIFREVQGWFDHCDIVATPTLSRTALPIKPYGFPIVSINSKWL